MRGRTRRQVLRTPPDPEQLSEWAQQVEQASSTRVDHAVEAVTQQLETASQAAMNRADSAIRVAQSADEKSGDLAVKASEYLRALDEAQTVHSDLHVTDQVLAHRIDVLVEQVQGQAGRAEQDQQVLAGKADSTALAQVRALLQGQLDGMVSNLAGKASAESLTVQASRIDTVTSQVAGMAGQVSALVGGLAGKASDAALSALTTRVTSAENTLGSLATALASKASVGAVEALASTVSVLSDVVQGKASTSSVTALAARVTALENRPVVTVRTGFATVPVLGVLASKDLTVTWTAPMPAATYKVLIDLESTGDQWRAVLKSRTATDCTITITAAVAITVAQKLDVVAVHTT